MEPRPRLLRRPPLRQQPHLGEDAAPADATTRSSARSRCCSARRSRPTPGVDPANSRSASAQAAVLAAVPLRRQPQVAARRMSRRPGRPIDEKQLIEDSKRYAMLMRKYQIETFRREVPTRRLRRQRDPRLPARGDGAGGLRGERQVDGPKNGTGTARLCASRKPRTIARRSEPGIWLTTRFGESGPGLPRKTDG